MRVIDIRRLVFAIAAFMGAAIAPFAWAQSSPPGNTPPSGGNINFVPNSQAFWDNSKNWTTNYGPAYRDTVLTSPTGGPYFVPCTGTYALCFHSGPQPLPCEQTPDGRFANCKCTVQRGVNWVLITAILNYQVYEQTIMECNPDGSGCANSPDSAPVCAAIKQGALIPGADVISTYSPSDATNLYNLHTNAPTKPPLTVCPKGPYAGCMTASCKKTSPGYAECSCPVFWGIFQLTQANAACTLGGHLVWSSSYDPTLDGTE